MNSVHNNGHIKILHVLFSLEPGGMENGIVNVARALPADKFEIHVACLETSGAFAQRLPQPGNVHVLNKPPGFSPRTVVALNRVIARVKPHIVHTHNLGPLIYGGLASVMGRWPMVLQGEHTFLAPPDRSPKRLRQRAWFYRCCRRVHTVSEGVREQLIELGFPREKIVTLLNGVDCERFAPGDRLAARRQIGGLPENALVLGIVGRLTPLKGHARLIESFAELRRQDIHLMVIGGGAERERLIDTARICGVTDRVHFTGFQENPLPYYQALDLLVAPSTLEGLSNAVLEAMACGVPVLAHPACGNPEVISHGKDGFMVELDTAEKLTRELQTVLAGPARLPLVGRAARERVERDFSFPVMAEKYQRLYQSLTGLDGR